MNWSLIISNTLFTAISVQSIAFILAAIGVNMHFGFTGLLNFGQAGFAAVGAYTYAVFVGSWGWPWWTALLGLLVTVPLLALILGGPTLRLRADYLAIVTIASAEIIRQILIAPKLEPTLGGNDGLQGFTRSIERFNPFGSGQYRLWKQPFDGHQLFIILLGWIVIALCSVLTWLLMRSPWGRVLKSIREDEEAARSLGKNVFAYKMQSLVIGGMFGALGGLVFAVGGRAASPGDYATRFTFFAWTILILGGAGKVKGPIIGGIMLWSIIAFFEGVLAGATKNGKKFLFVFNDNNFGLLRWMIIGLGLALLVIFRPQGIFGDKREQAFDVR
jgi:neutral amino acid transport system permease protein